LLIIKRIDSEEGWGYCHSCDIYILDTDESVYLFPEKYTDTNIMEDAYVSSNDIKIFDSRDKNYYKNGKRGWGKLY